MKAKRIMCLLLAVLMVMGTVTWLITLIASADELKDADTVSVMSAYSLEQVYSSLGSAQKNNPCYIKGSSEKTSYTIRKGYYADFNISLTMSFEDSEAAQAFLDENGSFSLSVDSGSFSSNSKAATSLEVYKTKVDTNGNLTLYISVGKVLYNGEGSSLGFTVYSDGKDYSSSHTISISQCEPYQSDSDDDEDYEDTSDIPDPTPYVIVSGYNYGGGNVTAGQEFTLDLTIENTSMINVGNMTMTISTPDAFTLVNSSNTVYIESLPANDTFSHSIRMMTRASAEPEPAVLEVSFDYQYIADGTRKDVARSEKIAIPVSQRDRFQVEELVLPPQLWVGEEYDLEVKYINKGRSTVYNLSAALQGEGLVEPNQSENVGNIESGKSGTVDFFLMTDIPGTLSGNVVVTYEDVNMNEKTITLPYSIEVIGMDEPVYEDPMAGMIFNEDGSYYGPDGILYGPDKSDRSHVVL